jgi:hypothetical protein
MEKRVKTQIKFLSPGLIPNANKLTQPVKRTLAQTDCVKNTSGQNRAE